MKRTMVHSLGAFAVAACMAAGAPAQALSDASAASALSIGVPVAASIAAPVAILSTTAVFTVVAVTASAEGAVWVLERASDGTRCVLRFAGNAAADASLAVGASVTTVAIGTGWLLSAAGEAIAFIPNEIGASLLYNEQITQ